jgi:hypothetical protein
MDGSSIACHTLQTRNMAGKSHVLSVGIDLLPALISNGSDESAIANSIGDECLRRKGWAMIGHDAAEAIRLVVNILSIGWVLEALEQPAQIICPRSAHCPRHGRCGVAPATRARDINDVKQEILLSAS